jgi:hypothetical protein
VNPGGDAYDQLSALGAQGRKNIIDFMNRGDTAYVGFCAGAYIASHDYIWESLYEGPGYYNFAVDPPLSIFPHTVEGSLTDINDDQVFHFMHFFALQSISIAVMMRSLGIKAKMVFYTAW